MSLVTFMSSSPYVLFREVDLLTSLTAALKVTVIMKIMKGKCVFTYISVISLALLKVKVPFPIFRFCLIFMKLSGHFVID